MSPCVMPINSVYLRPRSEVDKIVDAGHCVMVFECRIVTDWYAVLHLIPVYHDMLYTVVCCDQYLGFHFLSCRNHERK